MGPSRATGGVQVLFFGPGEPTFRFEGRSLDVEVN